MARIVADLHRLTQNQRERDCLLARRYAVV
jgi:hypothetical protein